MPFANEPCVKELFAELLFYKQLFHTRFIGRKHCCWQIASYCCFPAFHNVLVLVLTNWHGCDVRKLASI